MNSVAAASASSRAAFIVPAGQLAGVVNRTISDIYFHKATTTTAMAAGGNFKLYLKPQSGDFTTATVEWADVVAGAQLVFDGDPSAIVGTGVGWKNFPFTTNYFYTGNESLMILAEYTNPNASTAIVWSYDFNSPCVNTGNTNSVRITNTTSGLPNTLSSSNFRRPYLAFDTVPTPVCTAPPVAGTLNAPSSICPGENFFLTVSGAATSLGQTFQLQSSVNNTVFSNVGSPSVSGFFTASQTVSTWYRVAVTCNGNTTNSAAVLVAIPSTLNGNFTINKNAPASATNFTSFSAAATAIRCGISGPTTFNVVANSGPYNEQFILPAITGTSNTNRIVINGNGNTISFAATGANRPIIHLNGTDFVTIDSLNVESTTAAGWGIVLSNGADSNIIRRSVITLPFTTTTSDQMGIAINGNAAAVTVSGVNGSGNLIERNTVNGGFYNIYLYGSSTAGVVNTRNIVRNNVLRDPQLYNVFVSHQQQAQITENDMSRPTRTNAGTAAGVWATTGVVNALVQKNRIHDLNTAATSPTQILYGIYYNASPTAAGINRFENNLIYNFYNNNGAQYGIWSTGGDSALFYHNTIVLDDAAATAGLTYGIGVSTTAASGLVFRNNLVAVARGGTGAKRALYFGVSTVGAIVSNNNAFWFSPSGGSDNHFGQIGATTTTPFTTLLDWKGAANGAFDGASEEGDPAFVNANAGVFRPQQSAYDNIGAANLGVATDIVNVARSSTSPDPGAYEFTGNSCSNPPAAGQAIVSRDTLCQGSNFVLNLSGNSSGSGQTYQWQISANGSSWSNLTAAPRISQSLDTFQTSTNFYRAAVRCQNGTVVFSQPVLVTNLPPLAGLYTINSGSPTGGSNFSTITEAVEALRCGVAGPVTFEVAPGTGPYNEQIVIDSIAGASAVNRIRFLGNGETVTAAPVTGSRSIFRLNNAQFITLDSFVIQPTSTTFGWGIHLLNGARFDSIRACTIDLSAVTSTSESNSIGIYIGNSLTAVTTGGAGSFNAIVGNTIIGGWKSIGVIGLATTQGVRGNVIRNNVLRDFYSYGIELGNADSITIEGNDIHRITRTSDATTFYGVYLGANSVRNRVAKNRIHDANNSGTGSSSVYGLYVTASDAVAGQENRFENNAIYNLTATGSNAIYGIYNASSNGAHFVHNTVSIESPASSTGLAYGFFQTTEASNIRFYNNLVYVDRNSSGLKYALYFATAASIIRSNYNVLYVPGTTGTNGIGFAAGQGFATMAAWRTANSNAYDTVSLSVDPIFTDPSNGDFTPLEASIDGTGRNEGVTTDLLERSRTSSPDPGAFELSLPPCGGTPVAGQANTSDTVVCANQVFVLSVANNTIGTGIRYQWQRSTDNLVFTNIGAPQASPILDTAQLQTSYYRVAVSCNTGAPVFSTSVFVRTQAVNAGGTFTINPSAPATASNFVTLTDAATALRCGINSSVTFNVASGAFFNEQLVLGSVPGTSIANFIRFNGNGAIINFNSSSTGNRAGVRLNGSRHVTIDSFVIQATGSTAAEFGYGVQLHSNADSNTISRCNISVTTTPATATSINYAGIVINTLSSGTATGTGASQCDGNRLLNNVISGGHTGISVLGSTTNQVFNNQVIGNRITDFYTNGILHSGGVNTIIRSNEISRPGRSAVGAFYGVNLAGGTLNVRVEKNRIHTAYGGAAANTLGTYGVNINGADATLAEPNIIANNMIYNFNGGGIQNGFLNTGSNYAYYYYNSVLLDEASPGATNTTRAFYQTTAADSIRLWGNNFVVTRGGANNKEVIYFNTATTTFTSRFNNLHLNTPGATNAFIANLGGATSGTNYATLTAWQASAPRRDTGSLSVDPLFVSNTDLHLQNASTLIGAARPIPGIADDIDGESRGLSFTTMGADEKASALPVAWLSFQARAEGNVNRLLWATGSELNNLGFDVQRSANGQGFEKMGRVASQGANGGRYEFVDANPLPSGSYYRLAQQDANGQLNYSKTLYLPGAKQAWQLTAVYPNPVRHQLTLQVASPAAAKAQLQVLSAQGALVMQQPLQLQAGTNTQLLNVAQLAAGTYVLRLLTGDGSQSLTTQFVKQ